MLATSALYISLSCFLFLLLSMNVSRLRMQLQVSLGTGEKRELRHATRAQANLAEHLPPFIALLILCELLGGSSQNLHIAGGLFLTSRLMHAGGMLVGIFRARTLGIALCWGVIGWLGVWALLLRP